VDMRLDGKKVLVTGGTRGLGRGLVLAFARAGADVLTCARSGGEAVNTLVQELKEIGGEHHVMRADITDPDDLADLLGTARSRLRSVDTIVTNAGAISRVPFERLPLDEWQRVIDTTLTSAYLLVQGALPLLRDGSSVILIGSRSALEGVPLRAADTAANAGLIGLARTLAKELGPRHVRVNVLAPGVVEPEDEPLPEEVRQRYERQTALGRLGRPAEIAGAALFLASDLARYVTGEVLNVDGGI